ncbi:MAG: MarR family winged helix-turn-helix transcriptional regulator [Candidatus Bathyarchaeia archaeon]|jgi:DNA-binding MarR family transcriptional regulator
MNHTLSKPELVADRILRLCFVLQQEIDRKIVVSSIKDCNAEITFQNLLIMKALEGSKGTHMNAIGELLNISKAQMTQSIDKLVILGMVSRQDSPKDRRKIDIYLTEEGKRVLEAVDKIIKRKIMEKISDLSNTELDRLLKSLEDNIDFFVKDPKK